jgi:hypothetical protein
MVAALSAVRPAVAQPNGGSSLAASEDTDLQRAKALFREGVALFQAGNVRGALDAFLRSRAIVPSAPNGINAALCLERLGRYDEALETYERVLVDHEDQLDEHDRAGIKAAIARLVGEVAWLEVASNVEGTLVIDGRGRGKLPRSGPVHLLPGRHAVRVMKDGYATFEAEVTVEAKTTTRLDARLDPLARVGGLRVEDARGAGAQVLVDGAVVGDAPWEGTLGPGPHVVQTVADSHASAPTRAIVLEGQTTLLRLRSATLGGAVRVMAEPASAEVLLGDVALGRGRWEGVLPAGNYVLSVREPGYVTETKPVSLDKNAGIDLAVRLRVDPEHPRWPREPSGRVRLDLVLGPAIAGSLRSGPEIGCSGCDDGPALGWWTGLRAAFELPAGTSLELSLGHALLQRKVDRPFRTSFRTPEGQTVNVSYGLGHELAWGGPYVGVGAAQRANLAGPWSMTGRVTAGVVFASGHDRVEGEAWSGQQRAEARVPGANGEVTSTPIFVLPEVGMDYAVGKWRVGAALGVLFVPSEGPELPTNDVVVKPDCPASAPESLGCAPAARLGSENRSHGPFEAWVPQVRASYTF